MRKVGLLGIALVLALGLLVPMAAPAVACEGANSVATIEALPTQVSLGGTVVLTITEKNTGLWDLEQARVELTAPSLALTLDHTSVAYGFWSSGNDDSTLAIGETWRWTVSRTVSVETTFEVNGHGIADGSVDVTYPDYPTERASVTVTVTPNGGGEGFTPGFWKNHLDEWPIVVAPYDAIVLLCQGIDMPLTEAIRLKGGRWNALVRHAAAGILNALHSGVSYDYTADDILNMLVEACATGDWRTLKKNFQDANEQGGDLNG